MNLSCLLICNLVNEDLTPSTEMNNADQCKVLYDQGRCRNSVVYTCQHSRTTMRTAGHLG